MAHPIYTTFNQSCTCLYIVDETCRTRPYKINLSNRFSPGIRFLSQTEDWFCSVGVRTECGATNDWAYLGDPVFLFRVAFAGERSDLRGTPLAGQQNLNQRAKREPGLTSRSSRVHSLGCFSARPLRYEVRTNEPSCFADRRNLSGHISGSGRKSIYL